MVGCAWHIPFTMLMPNGARLTATPMGKQLHQSTGFNAVTLVVINNARFARVNALVLT